MPAGGHGDQRGQRQVLSLTLPYRGRMICPRLCRQSVKRLWSPVLWISHCLHPQDLSCILRFKQQNNKPKIKCRHGEGLLCCFFFFFETVAFLKCSVLQCHLSVFLSISAWNLVLGNVQARAARARLATNLPSQ